MHACSLKNKAPSLAPCFIYESRGVGVQMERVLSIRYRARARQDGACGSNVTHAPLIVRYPVRNPVAEGLQSIRSSRDSQSSVSAQLSVLI